MIGITILPKAKVIHLRLIVTAIFLIIFIPAVSFLFLCYCFPFPENRINEAQSGGSFLITDNDNNVIAWRVDKSDNWQIPIALKKVSPWVIDATIAAEDKRFWQHNGIDPAAVMRAMWLNLSHRRRISGASTISMQSMRLLWPKKRTYSAKAIESFRALEMEADYSKEKILELYLNLAPYGGNIIGIEAAARKYFDKPAKDLTLGEASLLAGIPQSPARFNPRHNLEKVLKRRSYVLARMLALGLATPQQVKKAKLAPIIIKTPTRAIKTFHFADYVCAEMSNKGGIAHTTLESEIQQAAQEAVNKHARNFHNINIDGCAAVVIDVAKSKLSAMIGSIEQINSQTGCINCATIHRQPGSLLKPFIYASAINKGLITPDTIIYDAPISWHGYRPRNMDRQFLGKITASQALKLSRNIPAVSMLERIGIKSLVHDLQLAGLNFHEAKKRYGLSLALGTAEVRLIDIANAYAALAREGVYLELKIFNNKSKGKAKQIYTKSAAYLLLRALGATSPEKTMRPVWKTGTSWNHHDAWAIAMTPRYVVAVWCGKMSGKSHAALTGSELALPLALDIISRITDERDLNWQKPKTVKTRFICTESGKPATSYCKDIIKAEYIPGVSNQVPCPLNHDKTYPIQRNNLLNDAEVHPVKPITILSPVNNGEYFLTDPNSNNLIFQALADTKTNNIYWFINGELLKKIPNNKKLKWQMKPGNYELIAANEKGNSAKINFTVKKYLQ